MLGNFRWKTNLRIYFWASPLSRRKKMRNEIGAQSVPHIFLSYNLYWSSWKSVEHSVDSSILAASAMLWMMGFFLFMLHKSLLLVRTTTPQHISTYCSSVSSVENDSWNARVFVLHLIVSAHLMCDWNDSTGSIEFLVLYAIKRMRGRLKWL